MSLLRDFDTQIAVIALSDVATIRRRAIRFQPRVESRCDDEQWGHNSAPPRSRLSCRATLGEIADDVGSCDLRPFRPFFWWCPSLCSSVTLGCVVCNVVVGVVCKVPSKKTCFLTQAHEVHITSVLESVTSLLPSDLVSFCALPLSQTHRLVVCFYLNYRFGIKRAAIATTQWRQSPDGFR